MAKRNVKAAQAAEVVLEKPEPQVDANLAGQVEQLKAVLENQPVAAGQKKPRGPSPGKKIHLIFKSPDGELDLDIPCRWQMMTTKSIDAERKKQIVHRHVGSGELVAYGPVEHFHKGWHNLDRSKEYPESEVAHYQIQEDGKEAQVDPFPTTGVIEGWQLIPITRVDNFLQDGSIAELWSSERPADLWKVVKWLLDHDNAILYSGFKKPQGDEFKLFHAVLAPYKSDGKFGVEVVFSQTVKERTHLMSQNGENPVIVKKTGRQAKSLLKEVKIQ